MLTLHGLGAGPPKFKTRPVLLPFIRFYPCCCFLNRDEGEEGDWVLQGSARTHGTVTFLVPAAR